MDVVRYIISDISGSIRGLQWELEIFFFFFFFFFFKIRPICQCDQAGIDHIPVVTIHELSWSVFKRGKVKLGLLPGTQDIPQEES